MPIPAPRLCYVRKKTNSGFGFHLTSHRGRPGQFISSVEEDSPAEYAGLLVGDRVALCVGDIKTLLLGDRVAFSYWDLVRDWLTLGDWDESAQFSWDRMAFCIGEGS